MPFTPADLDFPPKFSSFRPAQDEAFEFGITDERRFTMIGAPPGVGKSGLAYGFSKLLGGRTTILTADKGLQQQYCDDHFSGMIDMRGRKNYSCWEGGTCEDGARQDCKDHLGCPYKINLGAFNQSDVGLSNYAWWIAINNKARQGCAIPDTLICDESHLIFDWLSKSLDFMLSDREIRDVGIQFGSHPPKTIAEWQEQYAFLNDIATQHYEDAREHARTDKSDRTRAKARSAESFLDKIHKIPTLTPDNWVLWREEGRDDGRAFRFKCVWPYKHKENVFQHISRVILLSATNRPKTAALLGISKSEYSFREWGRQFPAVNGPVIWYQAKGETVRVNYGMSADTREAWLWRIGQIANLGKDRKGLIHSISYERSKEIAAYLVANGKHSSNIVVNGAADPNSQTSAQAYEQFKRKGPGAVLISPSFSTGWDFKGKAAEWQIISKLKMVDTRKEKSPVMYRRKEDDPTYPNYLTAQDLVQSCGRVQRSETDRGTTYIVDDSWSWFRGLAEDFVPRWFKVRRETELPRPLPLLED